MESFCELLLADFDRRGRLLPWRGPSVGAYEIWISEIMLQQTRIEAVKPYYAAFLAKFPNVYALASAPEDSVLKAWEGLGYYSRARNLQKAAATIVTNHQGRLPKTKEALLKLPGIGDYTSSAISCLAYGEPNIAVDGNLLRLYTRLEADSIDIKTPQAKKKAEAFFAKRMDHGRAGDYLSALMDLGELVCLPGGAPKCSECPLNAFCKAHAKAKELDYPLVAPKTKNKAVPIKVFLVKNQGRIALRKRPDKGLMAGLYELPNIESEKKEKPEIALEKLGFAGFCNLSSKGKAKHVFTHLTYDMDVYEVECPTAPESYFFVDGSEIEKDWPMPTCFKKLLA